eukprot:6465865-Amphidinium_carterae.1
MKGSRLRELRAFDSSATMTRRKVACKISTQHYLKDSMLLNDMRMQVTSQPKYWYIFQFAPNGLRPCASRE